MSKKSCQVFGCRNEARWKTVSGFKYCAGHHSNYEGDLRFERLERKLLGISKEEIENAEPMDF